MLYITFCWRSLEHKNQKEGKRGVQQEILTFQRPLALCTIVRSAESSTLPSISLGSICHRSARSRNVAPLGTFLDNLIHRPATVFHSDEPQIFLTVGATLEYSTGGL